MVAPGQFVLSLLTKLEIDGLPYAYLRNYQDLPASVGNDVDLLVAPGRRRDALGLIRAAATGCGWRVLKVVEFSPLSVFLVRNDGVEWLHIDLFDRLEWHWVEYADASVVLARRRHNGMLFHPAPGDEVYLNVCTRLVYSACVRDKHRQQADNLVAREGVAAVHEAFALHLPANPGRTLAQAVAGGDWQAVKAGAGALRRQVILHHGLLRPRRGLAGLGRFFRRSMARLLRPPGPFLVFVGADGVGKTTVIDGIVPLLHGITGRTDPLCFDWEPCQKDIRDVGTPSPAMSGPPHMPPRGPAASLVYLTCHWLGIWWGWIRFILPARARNRAVIGECYAFDLVFDPARFGLRVPGCILRLAALTVPQPDLVVALQASPNAIHARKPELPQSQVDRYQERVCRMAAGNPRFRVIEADGTPAVVIARVSQAILNARPNGNCG